MNKDAHSFGVAAHADRRLPMKSSLLPSTRSDDESALERKLGILSQLTFPNYSRQT